MTADAAYRFGDFVISPADRRLYHQSASVRLPPKAFDALCLLVRRHGSLVTRAEIFAALWPDVHVAEANLTNIIVLLRKHLGSDAIQTVSKFGYRFTLAVTGEPGVNRAAYASFVRGKELLHERTFESMTRARDLFCFTIAKDPGFAPAWAWLGRAFRLSEKFRGEPDVPNVAEAAFERAFALDPDLPVAHHFYTQLQVDSGRAVEAVTRLALRLKRQGDEPETFAGLVQVLRCCGLLEESAAIHRRAVSLDPTIRTSVAHTFFLQGNYPDVFVNYTSNGFYLDAAAWAALGQIERAASLLRTRLEKPGFGPVMLDMMASLLAVLEGRRDDALACIAATTITREPEGLFYLARHCGMLNAAAPALALLRRAREEGFWCSTSLLHDPAFAPLRDTRELQEECRLLQALESRARIRLREALGEALIPQTHQPAPSGS